MEFSEQLQICIERVNSTLRHFIKVQPFQDTSLVQAMEYGALLGGKRLRSFLVYATGNMLGVRDDILDIPAAAVECIHAYSLIHDDLPAIDNNDLRRGLLTCHMQFGEDNAILAGDALQTLAFSMLSNVPIKDITDCNRLAMISELAIASGVTGMCGGQALDLEADRQRISLQELERIHRHKTGALIRAAVRLGNLSAGDNVRHTMPVLDQYAEYIGLAFQVQDDILDVVGNTVILGKRQGADRQLGKNTYPTLLGLEKARCKAKDLVNEACQSLTKLAEQSFDTSVLEALAKYIIKRDR